MPHAGSPTGGASPTQAPVRSKPGGAESILPHPHVPPAREDRTGRALAFRRPHQEAHHAASNSTDKYHPADSAATGHRRNAAVPTAWAVAVSGAAALAICRPALATMVETTHFAGTLTNRA
jgi:hypothetical protein